MEVEGDMGRHLRERLGGVVGLRLQRLRLLLRLQRLLLLGERRLGGGGGRVRG